MPADRLPGTRAMRMPKLALLPWMAALCALVLLAGCATVQKSSKAMKLEE